MCCAQDQGLLKLYAYTLNGHVLDTVTEQKDLGVYISNDLKPNFHVNKTVKKGNQMVGLIRRCFTDLTQTKVKKLYEAIVRPILEYGSPAWNPYLQKDISALEKVQDRCSKLCSPPLSLPSLAHRRKQADLCETYKYTHKCYKTDPTALFSYAELQLRGHPYKLSQQYARTEVRKNFFANRVVSDWNELDEGLVCAKDPESFKRNLRSLADS